MPELPEVETVRRSLQPAIQGRVLTQISILEPRLRFPVRAEQFEPYFGRRLKKILRHGKYLVMLFQDSESAIVIHLGMTGRILLAQPRETKWVHFKFLFETTEVAYIDPRRFGFIIPGKLEALKKNILPGGMDALSPKMNGEYLFAHLAHRKTSIKDALMNQAVLAGLGNIYASEILSDAHIHPVSVCCKLDLDAYKSIVQSMTKILKIAIRSKGTSMSDFYYGYGQQGKYQNLFRVYDRQGLPCPDCQTAIEKLIQSNRSTYFCPLCQKTA